jgi:hypothetical protein
LRQTADVSRSVFKKERKSKERRQRTKKSQRERQEPDESVESRLVGGVRAAEYRQTLGCLGAVLSPITCSFFILLF